MIRGRITSFIQAQTIQKPGFFPNFLLRMQQLWQKPGFLSRARIQKFSAIGLKCLAAIYFGILIQINPVLVFYHFRRRTQSNEAESLDQRYEVVPGNETTRNKQILN